MIWLGFVPASKMRLRRGLGYPTQITVPYVFTVCNPTLQKNFLHMHKNYQNDYLHNVYFKRQNGFLH